MNCSQEISSMVHHEGMNFLLIPAIVLSAVALLADPLLLFSILRHHGLRGEARYLLLANVFLSDVIFLLLNLAKISCNVLDIVMHTMLCELLMVSTVTSCCSTILTLTLMVMDTFVAVLWPLRYARIFLPSRVKAAVAAVWLLAACFPLTLLLLVEMSKCPAPKSCVMLLMLAVLKDRINMHLHLYFTVWVLFCVGLICYCYGRLIMVTKSSGIWRSRYSRARVTLLLHTLILFMYFTPCLVFTVQVSLPTDTLKSDLAAWLNNVNQMVLMVVPRAGAPYLYSLRYRELYYTVQLILGRRRPRHISEGLAHVQI